LRVVQTGDAVKGGKEAGPFFPLGVEAINVLVVLAGVRGAGTKAKLCQLLDTPCQGAEWDRSWK
jgi:hypothetical protein